MKTRMMRLNFSIDGKSRFLPSSLSVCQTRGNLVGIRWRTGTPRSRKGLWSSSTPEGVNLVWNIRELELLKFLLTSVSIWLSRSFMLHVFSNVQVKRGVPAPIRSRRMRTLYKMTRDKTLLHHGNFQLLSTSDPLTIRWISLPFL